MKRWITLGIILLAPLSLAQAATETPEQIGAPEEFARLAHARELLGKHYDGSIVRTGEQIEELTKFVHDWTHRLLKGKWKKQSKKIADTILEEARKHKFDPVFLMAVIENESSFNPTIRGPVGELGLMQLTRPTAKELAQKLGIKFKGEKTLKDPVTNIRLGAAYLAELRGKYDSHSRLYLAAYNMGEGNVRKALNRDIWPKDYASKVMRRYIRYYSRLHTELKDRLEKALASLREPAKDTGASIN